MQMHEAVRMVARTVVADAGAISGEDDLERHLQEAFAFHGLADHGYVLEYKAYAISMIRYYLEAREGHTPEPLAVISVTIGQEEIIVHPDDVLVRPDGTRTVRWVRTGHFRSREVDDVGAAAFLLAVRQVFPDADVELVHLSDQSSRPLSLSADKLRTRRGKLSDFLQDIRAGRFPAKPSSRTCPGCPAFFICGPTPAGTLEKNFR